MIVLLLALLIGVVAGLRAMMAPAAASWAVASGWVDVSDSWLAFMGARWTPWIFTALALIELVTDMLPATPSRKVPMQFGARLIAGALAGATLAAGSGMWVGGAVAGAIGAVIGTYGGAAVRRALARSFGADGPAALLEDAVAIIGGALIVMAL